MEYVVTQLKGEKDIFLKCLKLRDAGKIEEARHCLKIFVNSMSWKNTNFIEYYNSVCAPEDKIQYDMSTVNDAVGDIDSEEHKALVLDFMQGKYDEMDPTMEATSELMKVVNPELMTEVYLHQEKIVIAENSLMDNARRGNVKDAVSSAKMMFELYGMPGFSSLFQQVITDAWDMKLTGPYGFELDKLMSKEEDKLSSAKATLYLKKLIYVFSVLYPKMINTPVYERGIEMTQYDTRENLLTVLVEGLLTKLKEKVKGDDLQKTVYALNMVRIWMLFSESKEASANVLYSMDNAFDAVGIEKIYIPMPVQTSSSNYEGLDFDTEEFNKYGEQIQKEDGDVLWNSTGYNNPGELNPNPKKVPSEYSLDENFDPENLKYENIQIDTTLLKNNLEKDLKASTQEQGNIDTNQKKKKRRLGIFSKDKKDERAENKKKRQEKREERK